MSTEDTEELVYTSSVTCNRWWIVSFSLCVWKSKRSRHWQWLTAATGESPKAVCVHGIVSSGCLRKYVRNEIRSTENGAAAKSALNARSAVVYINWSTNSIRVGSAVNLPPLRLTARIVTLISWQMCTAGSRWYGGRLPHDPFYTHCCRTSLARQQILRIWFFRVEYDLLTACRERLSYSVSRQ